MISLLKSAGYIVDGRASEDYLSKQLTGKIPLLKVSPNASKYRKFASIRNFNYDKIVMFVKNNENIFGDIFSYRTMERGSKSKKSGGPLIMERQYLMQ